MAFVATYLSAALVEFAQGALHTPASATTLRRVGAMPGFGAAAALLVVPACSAGSVLNRAM